MGAKRDNLLYPLLKLAAGEHNAPIARQAPYANVGTDASHFPLVSTTRVRFAHTHPVADLYIERSITQ
jgi:hypothetical protein